MMFFRKTNRCADAESLNGAAVFRHFPVEKIFLFTITIGTFCLLLLYRCLDSVISPDGVIYVEMTETWYETGDFTSLIKKFPDFYIPPLPLWLPQFFMKFGIGAEKSLILVNMICASCMPQIVFGIAGELCSDKRAAYGAAVLMAVSPIQQKIGVQAQRDMIYLFFCALFLYVFFTAVKKEKRQLWILTGFFFSCSLLSRYETMEMLFPVVLVFVFEMILKKGKRLFFLKSFCVFLACSVSVSLLLLWAMGAHNSYLQYAAIRCQGHIQRMGLFTSAGDVQ